MSSAPRVSVVIPSYNHAAFLPECLSSVSTQTFPDWELVLVDDGSPDDSWAIAEEAAASEPRVRILRNDENLGAYGTLARAVSASRGELIAVLDSDDRWAPEKLRAQVELLDRQPDCGFCYTLGQMIDTEGIPLSESVHQDWPTDFHQEVLPRLLAENRILASSVVFRRAEAGFDSDLRTSGDWVALLRAARKSPAACVPADLTFWRQHGSNSFRLSPAQLGEEIRVRSSILRNPGIWKVRRLDVSNGLGLCARHLSALLVLRGEMDEARSAARTAMRFQRDRKSAMRRLMVVSLPEKAARKRLWPDQTDAVPKQGDSTRPISWEL